MEAASLRIKDVDVADAGESQRFESRVMCFIFGPFASGNYTCEVEWRGQPLQITHQLVVMVPPTIEAVLPHHDSSGLMIGQLQRPVEARLGTPVKLECRADGIPPPVIRWRRPQVGK